MTPYSINLSHSNCGSLPRSAWRLWCSPAWRPACPGTATTAPCSWDRRLVAAIDKLSVVLVALLAVVLLGEQLGLKAWLGVGLMAIGAAPVAWA